MKYIVPDTICFVLECKTFNFELFHCYDIILYELLFPGYYFGLTRILEG